MDYKYVSLRDIKDAIIDLNGEVFLDRKTAMPILEMITGLPTIEVSEDCIDRDLIINKLLNLMSVEKEHYEGMDKVLKLIEQASSVVPTVRKNRQVERAEGEWIPIIEGNEFGEPYQAGIYCSECGETLGCEANYCPNCGAKMKG